MAYSTASNVAKWFLIKNKSEELLGADMISNLKLQKLLYYAQGCTLAIFDEALFDDDIIAWAHGPVVELIYHQYKKFGSNGIIIEETSFDEMGSQICSLLENVYEEFGQYSAWKLRDMTHEETPWLNAKRNEVISKDEIKKYFIENYVS